MNGPWVGVDVVDLGDGRTLAKHEDARFLERVLAPEERSRLRAATDPRGELWGMWAAKEAAYKVASKLLGEPPVFAHAAFVVDWDPATAREGRFGTVTWGDLSFHVRGWWSDDEVHVVAASTPPAELPWPSVHPLGVEPLEALLPLLSPREAEAVHSAASASVRLKARLALALALGVEERRVEIVCDPGVTGRRPPRAWLDGAPAPADLSLSHHGRWLAWAVILRRGSAGS